MNNATTDATIAPTAPTTPTTANVLQSLRSLIPERVVTFPEALRIAELQASRLRQLLEATDAMSPTQVIAGLPHIRVEYVSDLPSGGLSFWDGRQWIIQLSSLQTPVRQRLSLFHQYKHIIDHGAAPQLYGGDRQQGTDVDALAERAADHFADCVLIADHAVIRADRAGAPIRQCIWLVMPANRQQSRAIHNRRFATKHTVETAGTA
jgi:hypothetical protein